MREVDEISFQLISNAGVARSSFFDAIRKARIGKFQEAQELIEKGSQYYKDAHGIHSDLIKKEASGEIIWMSLLMSHAEDLMMSSEISREMALELCYLYEELGELKKQISTIKNTQI